MSFSLSHVTALETACTYCFLRSDDLNTPYSWADLRQLKIQSVEGGHLFFMVLGLYLVSIP